MFRRSLPLLVIALMLSGTMSAQDKIRVFIGPPEMAPGVAAPIRSDEADSYRDLRKAFTDDEELSRVAELVDSIASADALMAVDKRNSSAWKGKDLKVELRLVHSEQSVILDGTKGFVRHFRVQARRVMKQAHEWIKANQSGIVALRRQDWDRQN